MLVNGEKLDLEKLPSPKIAALLEHFSLNPKTIAIERNGEILPKDRWDSVLLEEDDQIELIRFVGGG